MLLESLSKTNELVKKWSPLLERGAHNGESADQLIITARVLENESVLVESFANSTTSTMAQYSPIVMNVVRRVAQNLNAYELCGVQPLSLPTGKAFFRRAKKVATPASNGTPAVLGDEILVGEADTNLSGAASPLHTGSNPYDGSTYTTGSAFDTSVGESTAMRDVALEIDEVTVTAKTRQLRTSFSPELRRDLQTVHGINADDEFIKILSDQTIAEKNRELIRTIYATAKVGAQNATVAGTFNVLVDGEGTELSARVKSLMYQVMKESNLIGQETRMIKGNKIVASPDVVSALYLSGLLVYAPDYQKESTLRNIDFNQATYAGRIFDFDVYIDPFVTGASGLTVLAKGTNNYDAGLFYMPYQELELYPATDPETLASVIGAKTRYGMAANGFAHPTGAIIANSNPFMRKFAISNL